MQAVVDGIAGAIVKALEAAMSAMGAHFFQVPPTPP